MINRKEQPERFKIIAAFVPYKRDTDADGVGVDAVVRALADPPRRSGCDTRGLCY